MTNGQNTITFNSMENQSIYCEHCGASLRQRWDRITAGEAEFLIKFRDLIIQKGENLVNVPVEMYLSKVEYTDFQKLRFHALIAKHKEDGRHKRGWWVLTRRGNQFVKGEIQIPEKVRVFRNRITGYSENNVDIQTVLKTEPYWDNQDTIEFEVASEDVITDTTAQIVKKKKRLKKGQVPCPSCGEVLKKGADISDEKDGAVNVKYYYKCLSCGYRKDL